MVSNDLVDTVLENNSTMSVLLALVAQEGWRVHHMDVKYAFLNGDVKEEVYVR